MIQIKNHGGLKIHGGFSCFYNYQYVPIDEHLKKTTMVNFLC
jgi:hypothetical protein